MTHPGRFLPYVALPALMKAAIAATHNVTYDDVEKLHKALPEFLNRFGHPWILPWKDESGRWQAIDLSYFFPWQPLQSTGEDVAAADIHSLMQDGGFFGGPLPQLITAVQSNIDPFTQREIVNPHDPPERQVRDLMSWVWRLAAPSWLTDVGAAARLYEALTKETNKFGEQVPSVPQALARFVGVNVYPVDPQKTRSQNLAAMEREMKKVEQRMAIKLKDRSLDSDARKVIRDDYRGYLRRLRAQMREYGKESKVHPNLR